MISLLCVLADACSGSAAASGQPAPADEPLTLSQLKDLAGTDGFKPYAGNPVLSPGGKGTWDAGALGSMTVVKVGTVFHMYYEAWGVRSEKNWSQDEYNSLQIGHATSADGIHWLKDPANPVIPKGREEQAWDRDGTWDPFVIHEDGLFKMWYGGGNKICDWGYAVSTDGTRFTKKGRISRLGNVEDGHVVHDAADRLYHMYYWDRAREPRGLFRASSANETDFDFRGARPLRIEGEEVARMYKFTHVFVDDGVRYMLYGDFKRPHCPDSTVRLAVSLDGVAWTSVNRNLLEGHDGEIVKGDADLYLIYYGPQNRFDAKDCDVRVALYRGSLKDLARQRPPADANAPER